MKPLIMFHAIRDHLDDPDKCGLVLNWLNHYITEYCADMDRTKYLFYILCTCLKAIFKYALVNFCKCNCNYNDFDALSLDATSKSWSGSEIPLINSQLDFLEDLKQELRGIDFIEHRARISAEIQSLRSYKSRTEAEDFIERL